MSFKGFNSSFGGSDTAFNIEMASREIEALYGDTVSVVAKRKTLIKFGRNPNVGSAATGYTIWATGQDEADETYPALNTNSIDSVSAANSGDTQNIKIEGHTESEGNKTFVIQSATLNGQNRVALTTPLNRMTRLYNDDSTDFAGEIYGYENTSLTNGKPTDTTKIHITVPSGTNQSEKASTSLSSQDYWIITGVYADVLDKTASFADISLQIRPPGKVFRTVITFSASDSHTGYTTPNIPYLIAPKNSDIRLKAVADGAGTNVSGGIVGYLAIIV